MISKGFSVYALVIVVFAGLGMSGAVMADPVAEAQQLQDAGDVNGAYSLLEQTSTDLKAELKRNKSQLKAQISALSKVSSQKKMSEIKEQNNALLADRKKMKDQLKKVEAVMNKMTSLLEYQPYKDRDTAEGYGEFIASYPENTHVEEASYLIEDLEYEPFKEAGTLESLEEFIETFPTNRHIENAREVIEEMKAAQGSEAPAEESTLEEG